MSLAIATPCEYCIGAIRLKNVGHKSERQHVLPALPIAQLLNCGRIFAQVKLGAHQDYGGRGCVVGDFGIPLG